VCRACLAEPRPLAAEYFCVLCRTPFLNPAPLDEEGRCELCRRGLRGFDVAYSFGAYQDTLRELIHLFKYTRIRTLAGPLGKMIASAVPGDQSFDAVVPVPLHWRRRLDRGFNQSELLARAVARRYGLPVTNAVRRGRTTIAQAGLSNARRRSNVAGAFTVCLAAALTIAWMTRLGLPVSTSEAMVGGQNRWVLPLTAEPGQVRSLRIDRGAPGERALPAARVTGGPEAE